MPLDTFNVGISIDNKWLKTEWMRANRFFRLYLFSLLFSLFCFIPFTIQLVCSIIALDNSNGLSASQTPFTFESHLLFDFQCLRQDAPFELFFKNDVKLNNSFSAFYMPYKLSYRKWVSNWNLAVFCIKYYVLSIQRLHSTLFTYL